MRSSEFNIIMRDGHESHVYKWEPKEDIKILGVIQLVHGSCEHAKRYIDFAQFLTDSGYVVYANDLRGHGSSVKSNDDLGYFAEKNGWNLIVEDLYELTKLIKKEQESLKIFLLGHSMGSFLVRHYAIQYGTEINGVIVIGTSHNPRAILKFGKLLAERSIEKSGGKYRNYTLNRLSYGTFCNQFKPIRTKQDWLSRDEKVVDRFVEDEKCGFVFTSSAFRDMFDGLLFITDKKNIIKTPKDLPILLISGDKDPVGGNGKMVSKAYKEYKKAGINNIQIKLYKDMRHEILNEIGKGKVYEDVIEWLNNKCCY